MSSEYAKRLLVELGNASRILKNAPRALIRQVVFRNQNPPQRSFSTRLIARRKRSNRATLHRRNQGFLRGEYSVVRLHLSEVWDLRKGMV